MAETANAAPSLPMRDGPIATGMQTTLRAVVVRLPGADGPAIEQQPRPGRQPKNVLSLRRARLDRSDAVTTKALKAQLDLVVQMQQECMRRGRVVAAELKEVERQDKLIDAEVEVLSRQIVAILLQIEQCAKGGAR